MSGHQSVKYRSGAGSAIIETVVGLVALIPVLLFLFDALAMVLSQQTNDALAKHCARAAAETVNQAAATAAVAEVISAFHASNLVAAPTPIVVYPANAAQVLVVVNSTCFLPAPLPFLPASVQFKAEATEPVVAVLPP